MLTQEDVRNRLLLDLGSGVISVETSADQLDNCMTRALGQYNKYISRTVYIPLAVTEGTTSYDLSGDTYSGVITIVDVQYMPTPVSTLTSSFYETEGIPFNNLSLLGYDFRRVQEEIQTAIDLYGSNVDWKYDEISKVLYLKLPTTATEVILACSANYTLEQVRVPDEEIVYGLTLAYVKETLGLIRRKFGGAKLPGGEVNLDGESLVSEGKEEQEKYIEELKSIQEDIVLQG